jgi:hypothetical protein
MRTGGLDRLGHRARDSLVGRWHEAHPATLEFIAHAMLLGAHGRAWRLPRPRCHPCSTNTMVGMAAIRGVSANR